MAIISPSKGNNVAGCIHMGTASSTPPTSTSGTLTGFSSLGYISEDGVERSISLNRDPVKAWGGDVVAVLGQGKVETLKAKLIEVDNLAVLGLTFGNATGALNTGITVQSKEPPTVPRPFVIDALLADGTAQRLVIPRGVVSDIGNILYKDTEILGYELTITALADSSGVTCYEYTKAPSSGT